MRLIDVPYVETSPDDGIVGCFTTDGTSCTGGFGLGQPGAGVGLRTVQLVTPTVTSPLTLTKILVFVKELGSSCFTPSCALYSETLNVNVTVTP